VVDNGDRSGARVLARERTATPLYRRAQGGGGTDLHTKAKGSSPGRGMGSGEGRDVRARHTGYGGAARGRAARRGHVASVGMWSRAVRRKWEGPQCTDRRIEAGLGVRYGGEPVRDARSGTRHRARGRERLVPASCSIQLGLVQLQITPNSSTEVCQVTNSKVVDQLTLYHFHKGRLAFF
jgi:hypothetical protein